MCMRTVKEACSSETMVGRGNGVRASGSPENCVRGCY